MQGWRYHRDGGAAGRPAPALSRVPRWRRSACGPQARGAAPAAPGRSGGPRFGGVRPHPHRGRHARAGASVGPCVPAGRVDARHRAAGAPATDQRRVRLIATPIAGSARAVHAEGIAGLMDVALHPGFAANRLVYLTYTKPRPAGPTVGPGARAARGGERSPTWRICWSSILRGAGRRGSGSDRTACST